VRIDFHPAATDELESSADWYEERSPAAARGFAIAVDAAIAKIQQNPERFARLGSRHRSCSVERYPYQIVFRHDASRILVVAIAHAKRSPNYWRRR